MEKPCRPLSRRRLLASEDEVLARQALGNKRACLRPLLACKWKAGRGGRGQARLQCLKIPQGPPTSHPSLIESWQERVVCVGACVCDDTHGGLTLSSALPSPCQVTTRDTITCMPPVPVPSFLDVRLCSLYYSALLVSHYMQPRP